jgi:hypothetical protein
MEPLKTSGGRSEAGFTLIDMLFVVALIGLLATLAIPGLMRARGAAQASSSLATMRVINSGQLSFAITCGVGYYALDLPALGIVPAGSAEGFIPAELAAGPTVIKSGYSFSMAGTAVGAAPGSCTGGGPGQTAAGYALVADPLDTSPPARYFGTNADGVIYEDTASFLATMPEGGPPPSGVPLNK